MSFVQPFQLHNEVGDKPTNNQIAVTHIDIAQQEVETERKTTGSFATANKDLSSSQTTQDRLPSSNITDAGFVFAPVIKSVRKTILDAFSSHPEDKPEEHEYYRTGSTGELYARNKDGERLLTSSSPNSTLVERTLNGIRGFTDKFQFTASNETEHKSLSFHTLFGDVSIERTADGDFHVDLGADDHSNVILRTQKELQNFVSKLNRLLRLQPKAQTARAKAGEDGFLGTSATPSDGEATAAAIEALASGADKAGVATTEDIATTAMKADTVAIDFNTGVATITGGDQKNIQYDFKTGDLGVGGFGLGHFVFQQDGSTILSNGDMVDSIGALTPYAEILAKLHPSEVSTAASEAESNAPSLAASILAKAGSEPISQAEIVALMSLDSSLASIEATLSAVSPTLSLARTAIAIALAAALSSQKTKAPDESLHPITFDSPYAQTSRHNDIPQQFH